MKEREDATATLHARSTAGRDALMEQLFHEHYASLVRLAYCLLGDGPAAEDAAQEAFVSLHLHWEDLRDRGAVGAYLRRATINQCRTRQRRLIRGRGALARLAPPPTTVSSEDSAVEQDESRRLAAAIRSLPARQREVLVCRYFLGMSEAATSQALEIGVGSVKQHAHRARTALYTVMGEVR